MSKGCWLRECSERPDHSLTPQADKSTKRLSSYRFGQWRLGGVAKGAGGKLIVFLVHDDDAVATTGFCCIERLVGELNEPEMTTTGERLDAGRANADGQPLARRG